MSRCSNSSPRYSVRTTMPSLLILKISYVFNNKISITLLSFLICLGRSFPNPTTKVVKSCDNHLCCNRFICSLYKIKLELYSFIPLLFLCCCIGCRMFCLNFSNCSLNHSAMGFRLMARTNLVPSVGSFTTWKPAFSVVNFRPCSSE